MNKEIEAIYNNFINGNKKDMVEMIDTYGCFCFWPDFYQFLIDHEVTENHVRFVYIDVHMSYCNIKMR